MAPSIFLLNQQNKSTYRDVFKIKEHHTLANQTQIYFHHSNELIILIMFDYEDSIRRPMVNRQ